MWQSWSQVSCSGDRFLACIPVRVLALAIGSYIALYPWIVQVALASLDEQHLELVVQISQPPSRNTS